MENNHINASSELDKEEKPNQQKFKINAKNTKRFSSKSSPYQPLITHYCTFCKTPQNLSAIEYIDDLCIECSSPLHSSKEYLSMPRRFFSRMQLTTTITFYAYWPSNQTLAPLSDLSPTGLRFTTKQSFNKDQVIKIDADQFQAVGQVKHQKATGSSNIIGIEFITIQFNSHKGTFVSESA